MDQATDYGLVALLPPPLAASAIPPIAAAAARSARAIEPPSSLAFFVLVPARALLVDHFDNFAKIGSIGCPLVIIHGDSDRTIPCEQGRRLFAAAREPKRLHLVPGADHDDCFILDERGAIAEIRAALDLSTGAPP